MKKLLPAGVWLCFAMYLPCSAGTITGKIQDENQRPIEFATITLVKSEDSSLVKGEFTDANGFFSLEEIQNGRFDLIITDIGHKKFSQQNIKLDENHPDVELS